MCKFGGVKNAGSVRGSRSAMGEQSLELRLVVPLAGVRQAGELGRVA